MQLTSKKLKVSALGVGILVVLLFVLFGVTLPVGAQAGGTTLHLPDDRPMGYFQSLVTDAEMAKAWEGVHVTQINVRVCVPYREQADRPISYDVDGSFVAVTTVQSSCTHWVVAATADALSGHTHSKGWLSFAVIYPGEYFWVELQTLSTASGRLQELGGFDLISQGQLSPVSDPYGGKPLYSW